jgi:ABC-type uncharacterized transport system ATPase subunit
MVIEHMMDFVMGISDHVVVIDFGKKVVEGAPAFVANSPEAIAAYLGDEDEVDAQEQSTVAGVADGSER